MKRQELRNIIREEIRALSNPTTLTEDIFDKWIDQIFAPLKKAQAAKALQSLEGDKEFQKAKARLAKSTKENEDAQDHARKLIQQYKEKHNK